MVSAALSGIVKLRKVVLQYLCWYYVRVAQSPLPPSSSPSPPPPPCRIKTDSWLLDNHVNNWEGVAVENGRVGSLVLPKNSMFGRLPTPFPAEKGHLNGLTRLDLSDNSLRGPLPDSMSQLNGLKILQLGSNQFTGQLPKSFTAMKRLRLVDVRKTKLSGHAIVVIM